MSRPDYERSDASPRIAWIGLGAIGLMFIAALALCLVLLWIFDRRHPQAATHAAPPPAPRLEASPGAELAGVRRRGAAKLSTWRWTNAAKTHAQIPIERAMALRVQGGWAGPEVEP